MCFIFKSYVVKTISPNSLKTIMFWYNFKNLKTLFIAKDFDHNENIKEELEEFVELLKNGTPSEVEDFMILIANKIRINAGLCDHVCWTKVTETTE